MGFLAVSFDAPSQIEEFLREQPFHYRMARASVDELAASGIQSYPTHIVLDHNGIVVGRVSGLVGSPQEMKSKLKAWIDQALGASPHHRH